MASVVTTITLDEQSGKMEICCSSFRIKNGWEILVRIVINWLRCGRKSKVVWSRLMKTRTTRWFFHPINVHRHIQASLWWTWSDLDKPLAFKFVNGNGLWIIVQSEFLFTLWVLSDLLLRVDSLDYKWAAAIKLTVLLTIPVSWLGRR